MKRKKKKFKLNRKVWMEPQMMESAAFRSLSSKAMWVLLRFLQKRTWEDTKTSSRRKKRIYHDEDLVLTYSEAIEFGISRAQFHRILKLLVAKGFIDVQHQGGCYGRDYSRYKLVDRWKKYGTSEFAEKTKKRVLQAGLDVQSRKAQKKEKRTKTKAN